jgi:hypothetical protein
VCDARKVGLRPAALASALNRTVSILYVLCAHRKGVRVCLVDLECEEEMLMRLAARLGRLGREIPHLDEKPLGVSQQAGMPTCAEPLRLTRPSFSRRRSTAAACFHADVTTSSCARERGRVSAHENDHGLAHEW